MTRRLTAMLVALCIAGSLAGCATMPASGRVVVRDDRNQHQPFDDPYLRILPIKPQNGWTPDQVVSGFLTAMASFDDDHAALDDYLAPGIKWNPGLRPKVTVLDDVLPPSGPVKDGDTTTVVQVAGKKLGTIMESGQYTAEDEKAFNTRFSLKLVAPGKWRIAEIPDGLLLKQSDVERAFRTINLYFFAPDETVLVPDSIFLPLVNRADLPSQLVNSLLGGATLWLRPAVKTYFPAGTKLEDNRVRVENEIATVNLSKEAAKGSIRQMSAQLMWTLKQLTDIKGLRLEIDGKVQKPNGEDIQKQSDWQNFDPDMSGGTAPNAYMLIGGNVSTGGKFAVYGLSDPQPMPSFSTTLLVRPALSLDGTEAAGVSPDKRQLIIGKLDGPRPHSVLAVPKGSEILRPSWDRAGNLWIVVNTALGSELYLRKRGEDKPVQLSWTDLGGSTLQAIRVARDGVRVAVLVKVGTESEIRISRIDPNTPQEPLSGFRTVNASLVKLTDLAWLNADTLAVLGSALDPNTVGPWEVPISGKAPVQIGSTGIAGVPKTISANGPNLPILLGIESPKVPKAQVCSQKINEEDSRFSSWVQCKAGYAPTYPG